MAEDGSSLIGVLLVCALWLLFQWYRQHHPQVDRSLTTTTTQRLLKPRTPDACPACRHALLPRSTPAPTSRQWRELKSRCGAPKRIATDGFACPNPACAYYRITDAEVHALVGDGTHGKRERIQTLRCGRPWALPDDVQCPPAYPALSPQNRIRSCRRSPECGG